VEDVLRQAKDFVLRHGYHPPVLWIQGTNGRKYILFEEFPNEYEEKVALMYVAGKQLAQQSKMGPLNNVFLVMEAWMGKNRTIRPSQDPERIEVLIISRLDVLTQEQTVITLEYIRDVDGILREIKDMVLPDGETAAKAESPLLPAFIAGYTGR